MTAMLSGLGWMDLLGSAALAGGVVYGLLIAPLSQRGRRAVHAGALLVTVALLLELALTRSRLGTLATSRGLSLWWDILGTRWGTLWIARSVGLAAILAVPLGAGAQVILVAVWLLARSLQGHAGAQGIVPAGIDWVHLSAACLWMGCLLQFFLGRTAGGVDAAERLRRVATLSVAALVPAGIYAVFLHVPRSSDLITSPYGLVLLAKITLAVSLIVLGAWNHFVHVPALRRDGTPAFVRLHNSVRLELASGALVLLLSAMLGALPMPGPTPP